MTNARLARYTAASGQVASFIATKRGGQVHVLPLSLGAETWLRAHVEPRAIWQGDELSVDTHDFSSVSDGAVEAGFLFERSAFPN